MKLNDLSPAEGARQERRRVGRGIGSGLGKTAGRGHKGQKSRSGGFHKVGFEGGQMPLYRRLPKRGFRSMTARFVEQIRLSDINRLGLDSVDVLALQQAGLVSNLVQTVRIIASGDITKPVAIKGIKATKGAQAAIVAAGGSVEA